MIKRILAIVAVAAMVFSLDLQAKRPSDREIERELQYIMDENEVSAMSIALVKGNETIYSNALGFKDREKKQKVGIGDIYRIASVSKSFTGAAVMQLVEKGLVSLDSDVKDILGINVRNPLYPDVPVTVRLLLCHCSSIIDGKVPYGTVAGLDMDHPDKTTAKIYAGWAPGERYDYSNRGINLLGCVIEKVSGERFDEYVRNHILVPLGIENAGFNVDSLDRSKFVTLYKVKDGTYSVAVKAYEPKAEKLVAKGTYRMGLDAPGFAPCGGMKISVLGLAEWMKTLKNRGVGSNGVRILSEESVDMMFAKQTPDNVRKKYGFCVNGQSKMLNGRLSHGHNGSAQGLKSCMYFNPSEDWGVVAMCSSHSKADVLAYKLAAEYLAGVFIDK